MNARQRHVVVFALAVFFAAFGAYVFWNDTQEDETLGLWDVGTDGEREVPRDWIIDEPHTTGLVARETLVLNPADNVNSRTDLRSVMDDYGVAEYFDAVTPDLGSNPAVPDFPVEIRLENPED